MIPSIRSKDALCVRRQGTREIRVRLFQAGDPILEPSFSKLPVRGFEAVLFAVATDFANAIVGAAEAMTIKARKIRDLLQELPGTLSVLRSRNGLMRTHVPTLGGVTSRGVKTYSRLLKSS